MKEYAWPVAYCTSLSPTPPPYPHPLLPFPPPSSPSPPSLTSWASGPGRPAHRGWPPPPPSLPPLSPRPSPHELQVGVGQHTGDDPRPLPPSLPSLPVPYLMGFRSGSASTQGMTPAPSLPPSPLPPSLTSWASGRGRPAHRGWPPPPPSLPPSLSLSLPSLPVPHLMGFRSGSASTQGMAALLRAGISDWRSASTQGMTPTLSLPPSLPSSLPVPHLMGFRSGSASTQGMAALLRAGISDWRSASTQGMTPAPSLPPSLPSSIPVPHLMGFRSGSASTQGMAALLRAGISDWRSASTQGMTPAPSLLPPLLPPRPSPHGLQVGVGQHTGDDPRPLPPSLPSSLPVPHLMGFRSGSASTQGMTPAPSLPHLLPPRPSPHGLQVGVGQHTGDGRRPLPPSPPPSPSLTSWASGRGRPAHRGWPPCCGPASQTDAQPVPAAAHSRQTTGGEAKGGRN